MVMSNLNKKITIIGEWSLPSLRTRSKNKFVLISISCNRDYIFKFMPSGNFLDVLELDFGDISYEILDKLDEIRKSSNATEVELSPMSHDQAIKVVEFVCKYYNQIDEIIIHCAAGISRSAGVGKALAEWLNGSDKGVIFPDRHLPDDICYDLVTNAIKDLGKERKLQC